jgi:glycosyltransferase involved in cell wall biosynthesis
MAQATRIVIATRIFAPEVSAGAFRLNALASGFIRRACRVSVLTTTPPSTAPATPVNRTGLRLSRFPVLRDAGGNVRGYIQYLSFDIPLVIRLLATRYDLAVSEAPPTTGAVVSVISRLKRKPYAYYAADIWTDGLTALGSPRLVIGLMRAFEGYVMRHAATVLSISDEVTARIREFGVSPDRIATVGNGVDTSAFTPDGPVAESAHPYLIYTGTMSEWQGAEVFVRALPRVLAAFPDAQLRFFGQGASEAALRRLAADLAPGSVLFGGVVAPQEAARWLRGAAAALVSIVPGLGYDFARPTKTYAAAACGTPVVFAGVGSGGALVRENGLGENAEFTVEAVGDAMVRALEAQASGESARLRQHRVNWTEQNASLRAVGDAAAAAVLRGGGFP